MPEFELLGVNRWLARMQPAWVAHVDIDGAFDNIHRTPSHLVVDAPNVFAEHADRCELHASNKKHQNCYRRDSHWILIAVNDFESNDYEDRECAQHCDPEAYPHHHPQGEGGERENSISLELEGAKVAIVFACSAGARITVIENFRLWKTDEGH